MNRLFTTLILCCFAIVTYSQNIAVTSGSLNFLKGEKVIQFDYTYDDMLVGKMTEREYVKKKVNDYNEKERGRGDQWAVAWVDDRTERYQPKMEELFEKHLEKQNITVGEDGANYCMVFNTDFTEPGFNVGVMRRNASIDMTCNVFDISTGDHVASIRIRNSSANNFWGTDFDTGYRIQECYAKAGRELAKFFIKKAKL